MIQRIQTVYLALAFVCMALLLNFPVFSIVIENPLAETVNASFGAFGIQSVEGQDWEFPMYIVYAILALVSLLLIFLYKKRKKQLAAVRFNFILHVLLVMAIYSVYFIGRSALQEGLRKENDFCKDVVVYFNMDVGFFLVIPAMVFVFLAIRGIKTDIKLTQMAERLR